MSPMHRDGDWTDRAAAPAAAGGCGPAVVVAVVGSRIDGPRRPSSSSFPSSSSLAGGGLSTIPVSQVKGPACDGFGVGGSGGGSN